MMTKKLIYNQYFGAWLSIPGACIFASSSPESSDINYRNYPFDKEGNGKSYYLTYDMKPESYLFCCITRVIDAMGVRPDSAFAHIFRLSYNQGDVYDALRPDCFVTGTREILNKRELDKMELECSSEDYVFPAADCETVADILYLLIFGYIDGGKNKITVQCGTKEQFNSHMRSVAAFLCRLVPKNFFKEFFIGMSETIQPSGFISIVPDSVAPSDEAALILRMSCKDGDNGVLRCAEFNCEDIYQIKTPICRYFAKLFQSSDHLEDYYSQIESFVEEYKMNKYQACLNFMQRNGLPFSNAPLLAELITNNLLSKRKWYSGSEELSHVMAVVCKNAISENELSKCFDYLAETAGSIGQEECSRHLAFCLDSLAETGRAEDTSTQYLRMAENNSQLAELMSHYIKNREILPSFTEELHEEIASSQIEEAIENSHEIHLSDSESVCEEKKNNGSEPFSESCSEDFTPEKDEKLRVVNSENYFGEEDEGRKTEGDQTSSLSLQSNETCESDPIVSAFSQPQDHNQDENDDLEDLEVSDCQDDDPNELVLSSEDVQIQEGPHEPDLISGVDAQIQEDPHEPARISDDDTQIQMLTELSDDFSDNGFEPQNKTAWLDDLFNEAGQDQEDTDLSDFFPYYEDKNQEETEPPEDNASEEQEESIFPANLSNEEYQGLRNLLQCTFGEKKNEAESISYEKKTVPDNISPNINLPQKTGKKNPDIVQDDDSSQFVSAREVFFSFLVETTSKIKHHDGVLRFVISLILMVLVFALGIVFGSFQFNVTAACIGAVGFAIVTLFIGKIKDPDSSVMQSILTNNTVHSLFVLLIYIILLRLFKVI